MNKVYKNGVELCPRQLADEANAITSNKPFTPFDFMGKNSRIAGPGHCYCNGDGEFDLLPIEEDAVQLGGKRYMVCRKCGGISHL